MLLDAKNYRTITE